MKSALLPLSSLHNLTNLFLYNLDKSHRSILSLIAECCPSLTHLSVSGFRFGKKDILALVLGRLADYLLPLAKISRPEWKEDYALQNLVVPGKYLSSLCFTLRHFHVGDHEYNSLSKSVAVFLLRHFPFLEKIDECFPTVGAIKILHTDQSENVEEKNANQAKFEKACQEASSGLQLFNNSTLPVFSGIVNFSYISVSHLSLITL